MKVTQKVKQFLYVFSPRLLSIIYWYRQGHNYNKRELSEAYRIMYEDLAGICLAFSPRNILEFGCGYGYFLSRINERSRDKRKIGLYGIDFSLTQITAARSFCKDGHFEVCDLTGRKTKYKDREFDVSVGVGILMYVSNKRILAVLSELRRICGKKIIMAEYYYKYLSDEKKTAYRKEELMDWRFEHDYEDLLLKSGFKNIKIIQMDSFSSNVINAGDEMPLTLIIADPS